MALLLNGKRPYIPPARMDVYVSSAVQATRPHSKEDGVPLPIARIIEACWEQNPFDRPAFSQVSMQDGAARVLGAARWYMLC